MLMLHLGGVINQLNVYTAVLESVDRIVGRDGEIGTCVFEIYFLWITLVLYVDINESKSQIGRAHV